jgi:hypothetical protein
MDNVELKQIALFLLDALENHEHRIYNLQLETRALTETAQARAHDPIAFWEDYSARLARSVREKNDRGIPDFGGYDRTRLLIQQAKSDDQA